MAQEPNHTVCRRHPAAIGAIFGLLLLLPGTEARGFQMVTIDAGYGTQDTRLLRLNLSGGKRWLHQAEESWSWSYAWEANLSYWYLDRTRHGEKTLLELGLTPNFRLERAQPWAWGRPYLEAGIGIHLLSSSYIGDRNMSSAFQFGSHAGAGISFGHREQYELAWRIEHLSNGGLRSPNPGIDFLMVRFGYRW